MILLVPSTTLVSLGSTFRLVRWRSLVSDSWRSSYLAPRRRAMERTAATSIRSYQASSGPIRASSAIRSR